MPYKIVQSDGIITSIDGMDAKHVIIFNRDLTSDEMDKVLSLNPDAEFREQPDLWKKLPRKKRKEKIIKSSNIYKIEWDENNLWVHYNNESVYQYKDIPESVSIAVGEAKSAGSFLHRKVKGNYRYERIH